MRTREKLLSLTRDLNKFPSGSKPIAITICLVLKIKLGATKYNNHYSVFPRIRLLVLSIWILLNYTLNDVN